VRPQSGERIRVLIVDDVAETRENLRKLLSFATDIEVVGAAASGEEGIELAKEYQPHIVLMDINMPGMDGITATEVILQEVPTAEVVVLSVQGESDYLRRAMMAGARDFLTKPPSGDELMSTIRQVYQTGKKRAAVIAPARPAIPTAVLAEGGGPSRAGKVVAVFSPKGGTGCTTVAVNLAIALQQLVGSARKIALMDANLQFGDVGVMLNLSANRSIADLAIQIEELDTDMLTSVLAPHGSGIKVLLAPPHPEAAESLLTSVSPDMGMGSNASFKEILELVRQQFDITVVDMWSWVDDIALTVFDAAASTVLVATPDIPAIKSARLFLEIAGKLSYPLEEIALVLNRVDRHMGIRAEQIEQALAVKVVAQIPADEPAAASAANRGVPFVMRDQSRPISQGILQLAKHVQGVLLEAEEADEEQQEEIVTEPTLTGTGLLRLGRLLEQR
jgi:pilus assembly protein CpaE